MREIRSFARNLRNQSLVASRMRKAVDSAARRCFVEGLEERRLFAAFVVTSALDDGSGGTLREAIDDANNNPASSDIITFDASLSGQTITLTQGELEVEGAIRLTGLGADNLTISGNDASRIFKLVPAVPGSPGEAGPEVLIADVTLADGFADGDADNDDSDDNNLFGDGHGGAIYNAGAALTLDGVVVRDSVATGNGGGVYVAPSYEFDYDIDDPSDPYDFSGDFVASAAASGSLTLRNSTIEENDAWEHGGGIFAHGLHDDGLTIEESVISGNSANYGDGGGLYFVASRLDFYNPDDWVFVEKSANKLVVRGTDFVGNYALDSGGGLFIEDTSNSGVLIIDCNFIDNAVDGYGAGIHLEDSSGPITLRASTLTGNEAGEDGGGLYVDELNDHLLVDRCTFSGNSAGDKAGGLYLSNDSYPVTIVDTLIDDNHAGNGAGGLWITRTEDGTRIERTTISNNTTDGEGGGVLIADYTASILFVNSTISNNHALGDGGGVYFYDSFYGTSSYTEFRNSTIAGNTAGGSGGGLHHTGDVRPVRLTSTIVADNAADADPDLLGWYRADKSLIEVVESATFTVPSGSSNVTGVDPRLNPLALNGGLTPNHSLQSTSPAINKGKNPEGLTTDQRGSARVAGASADVGSFETQAAPPKITITDVTAAEGNTGTKSFVFTIKLDKTSASPVTVNYSTQNNSATAGSDYAFKSGGVTFTPGQVSKTVSVTVNGDKTFEPAEKFFVNLSTPVNATIADAQGVGTITNDDTQPKISINNAPSVVEGHSGTRPMTFTVTLSNASSSSVTVKWATADGTAKKALNDYQPASGTVTFAPGQTSKTIQVVIVGDKRVGPNETVFVNLNTPTNATILDGQGVGTIINDD